MSKRIQAPVGMKDWKDIEMSSLSSLEKEWMNFLEKEGFLEIRTPILESVDLFVRSVGEFSDIVSKEMFIVDDLVLRPEGTAPIMRSYLNDVQVGPKYFSYFAPFFRKERPQKGRFRQFYQYGCEVIGEAAPQAELLVLNALNTFYIEKNIKFRFEINCLPSEDGLKKYEETLGEFYLKNVDKLSDASKKRLENKSILRILDSKEDKELNSSAPSIIDFLSEEEEKQFSMIQNIMTQIGIKFQVNRLLVRGLDYYEGFVFEVVDESETLGSQNALGGGGRYNKLSKQLGAKETISAFGFAGGAERLLYQLKENDNKKVTKVTIISSENEVILLNKAKKNLLSQSDNIVVDINYDYTLSFKKMFKRADRLKSDFVIILGKKELEDGKYKIKELASGCELEFSGTLDEINLQFILSSFKTE